MHNPFALLDAVLELPRRAAATWLGPLAFLALRLAVAWPFLKSGWLKFGYVRNDQLDTLYFLFEDYKVPLLPVKTAAWLGMGGELVLGTLFALGLFGRFAALGLLVMTGVIYSVDQNAHAPYWAAITLTIAVLGPGLLSLDTVVFAGRKAGQGSLSSSSRQQKP